ncbi:MAG TPA: hypothetical protein VMA09_24365 [Candidatus Binataceae bacterium]|nr:hypothetical protein [Candidatus Binataceae bacterium]
MKYFLALIVPLIASGCAALAASSAAPTTATNAETAVSTISAMPKPSAFDYVGRSDTKVDFVNPAALLDDSTYVDAKVIDAQCAFRTADPPFLIPNDKSQTAWTFTGRLNEDGSFQALDYKSIFSLGIGEGAQQLGTWPVKLVAFSDFPDEYLEDRLATVAADKIDSADQHTLASRYIANSQRIGEHVAELERAYDPHEECAAR